jgi:hypothetical protein
MVAFPLKSLLPCIKFGFSFNPCSHTCFPSCMNPITRFLKSQLITPSVLNHWVPNTMPYLPNFSKLKVNFKCKPYILNFTSLHSPKVLITWPFATLTPKLLSTSVGSFNVFAKVLSMKLWVLPVSRRTTVF